MPDTVYDYHHIDQNVGERLFETIRRHLITQHNRMLTSSPTLNEMSALHARLHSKIGNNHPETDSATTKRQKYELSERVKAIGVELPEWIYTYSFLSDLKTLERILAAAKLARPLPPPPKRYPCCGHCDHSISQPGVSDHDKPCSEIVCQPGSPGRPDSAATGAPAGIDNPGKG